MQTRIGVCRSCGREVTLSSYDTRLCFVVLFIPIVPLGRKHIIDECPACRRHFVAESEKWEMARQLETSGALEEFRTNPTAENAIKAHQQFVAFHRLPEAEELQRTMLQQFADNAKVHVYLGHVFKQMGNPAKAEGFFQRAFELRPDLPEARIGVSDGCVRAGRLQEARQLLDFLEKPGAAQLYGLAPLERLAWAFQKAGQHNQALELFKAIVQELPQVGQHPGFRKHVKKSEKALKRAGTILPNKKFSLRGLFSRSSGAGITPSLGISGKQALVVVAVMGAIFIAVILVIDAVKGRHRQLYVVNGFDKPLQMEIPGVGKYLISRGVTPLTVPEGDYTVKLAGPSQRNIALGIHTSFLGRWLESPIWVLNPGGEAIIASHRLFYATHPRPGSTDYIFGSEVRFYPDIDFPFDTPPATLQIPSGSSELVKSSLEFFRGTAVEACEFLEDNRRADEAFRLAEWRLARHPDDKAMLREYARMTVEHQQLDRLKEFLRTGLTNRPVSIEWHRTYQNLLMDKSRLELIEAYDRMLSAEPSNSALLYLRGRLFLNTAEGHDYFTKAIAADPENPFPAYALAYDAAGAGNWAGAKELLDSPVKQNPDSDEFLSLWTLACLGLNEPALPEIAWQKRLKATPADYISALNLCQAMIAGHKLAEARAVTDQYRKDVLIYGKPGQQMADAMDCEFFYMTGDFPAIEKISRADNTPIGRQRRFIALVEEGRLDEADELRALSDPSLKDPYSFLEMALAWRVAGNASKAADWEKHGVALLRNLGERGQQVASVLTANMDTSPEDVQSLSLQTGYKAIVLANLAFDHPRQHDEFASAARRLNVARTFPYFLVQRATEPSR